MSGFFAYILIGAAVAVIASIPIGYLLAHLIVRAPPESLSEALRKLSSRSSILMAQARLFFAVSLGDTSLEGRERERSLFAMSLSGVSVALGAMSIMTLLREGFDTGFSLVLSEAIHVYDRSVNFLLGWADPVLEQLLGNWQLDLQPHWKHLLLGFLTVIAALKRLPHADERFSFGYTAIATSLALGVSLLLATAPPDAAVDPVSDVRFVAQLLPAVIVTLAAVLLFASAREASQYDEHPQSTWVAAFRRNALTHSAISMLAVLAGVAAVAAANVGLALAGL